MIVRSVLNSVPCSTGGVCWTYLITDAYLACCIFHLYDLDHVTVFSLPHAIKLIESDGQNVC